MIILIHIKNDSNNIYEKFHEKIIKSYFNIWYKKILHLLQKDIKLNIHNISVLMTIFINLCENSNINCNKKKIKIKYMICIILFIAINIKIILYLIFINKAILLLIHVTTVV